MSRGQNSERVLVVPASYLADAGIHDGFTRAGSRRQVEIICEHANEYMPRSKCETDPAFRQVIPYCVVRDFNKNIFTYLRPKKHTERRLASFRSLGVGGHVTEGDIKGPVTLKGLAKAAMREVEEEVAYDKQNQKFSWVGFINDTSTEVGRVHLGVVAVVDVAHGIVIPAEGCAETRVFTTMDFGQIHNYIDSFEPWSQFVIRGLFATPEAMRSRVYTSL